MPRRPVSLQSGDSANLRPEPRLLKAVEQNDVFKVREVIEDAQHERHFGRTLLSVGLVRACDKGHVEVARYLLTRGADPEYASGNKLPAILRAAERGQTELVEVLIDHRANMEAMDKKGRTALMTAAWKGHKAIVELLITRGAHVDTMDLRRRNVLHNIAADQGEKRHFANTSQRPKRKCGMDIVQYLLQAGVNVEAEDELGRTSVHWACVTDNEDLLKILLTTRSGGASPQARVNATDMRMKSPLQLAVSNNRENLVSVLIEHGADVHSKSDGDWTALHNACQSATGAVVHMLIVAGADANGELLNGRTPLHVAAEFGNVDAAEFLLETSGIKRSVKDRFGNTPLLIAAQKSKTRIVEMLAPWNHIHDLSADEIAACKQFNATIVDFGNFRNENRVQRRSVYELLYARDVKDATKHSISTLPSNIKATHFRWIHLPVNNIAWCDALLTKRFIEEGAADVEGYKSLETAFNHQHRGQQHHSRFMRPMCQIIHRTEADLEELGPPAVIVEEPGSLSPIPGTPTRSKSGDKLAKLASEESNVPVAAEPPKSKSKFPKPQRQSTTDTNSTMAASDASIISKQNVHPGKPAVKRQETDSTVATSGTNASKKPGKPGNAGGKTSKEPRKPSGRQSSKTSLDKGAASPSKRIQNSRSIFMFMPYLHFETDRRRREMQLAMENPHKLAISAVADEVLLRAHLSKSASFLHVRRTLDQFFYHNIDTTYRDCDQVVYRFQEKHYKNLEGGPKIFMVDQLWMWILGKDLVVTSFPQRWRQPRNDPLNVLEGIIEDINSKTREPVQDVYELAMTIAGRCFGTFDRHRKGDDDFQFLDMFESSIGAAMDNEASLFQGFSKASRQASDWLRSHEKRGRFSKQLEADSKAYEHVAKRHPDRLELDESQENDPAFINQLLDVGAETDLLAEIKDIRDELDIIRMVLDHQKHLLPELKEAVKAVYHMERSHARVRRAEKAFDDQEKTITNPIKDINRMEVQANRVYESIVSLLDLKQKHANAFEARFARDQAAGTQRQGQTIMVFTIVTIVFLPLSFITAFFAVNIEEFPHPGGAGSSAEIPLSYASSYIFGIGLAISVPAIAVALNVDRINNIWWRLRTWWKDNRAHSGESEKNAETRQIEETLSMAKSLRRSVEFYATSNEKVLSPPPRRSEEGVYARRVSRPERHLEQDLERGRRNARTDPF
ncbi:hypothetical protein CBER1_05203 [Cercospora berteroae]|uniref:Uncharacterized protein n=1 Tax=Cercospora berteroae TaxID=357750 RepID=A0A2S6BRU0_9PEZI|nr:hypothetical protein CBER1_05203 [Cercospora berteroae]